MPKLNLFKIANYLASTIENAKVAQDEDLESLFKMF